MIQISQIISLIGLIILISACSTSKNSSSMSFTTPFEKNANVTATYYETIDYFKMLAATDDRLTITPFGMTDIGQPLHEVVLSQDGIKDPEAARAAGKLVLFINNAIHPGEPCGVDASMMWIRDLVQGKADLPDDVVLVMVPFYNIGGGLNRNSTTRANQDGPEAHGFRGNVRNLDLNRDFVKCDSKNARSFNQLFNKWSPDVMVDNHTSNGADYQYVMTLIATQKDKLAAPVSIVMTTSMLPFLYKEMKARDWEMTPYVYSRESPDEGIYGFLDYARYSSGYAALHHTISFMPETHMLKPYADRVWSTYHFMQVVLDYCQGHRDEVLEARKEAFDTYHSQEAVAIDWQLDVSQADTFKFKGYQARYKPSEVSGLPRLFYDRNMPYEKDVPFYDGYKPSLTVTPPKAYVFPQAYSEIAERLEWNGVVVEKLEADTTMEVETYFIEDYEDIPAYEGHYLHKNIKVRKEVLNIALFAGDHMVRTDQPASRYIFETLEPQAPDGFFAWNFLDGILMQKEHFSAYVFEDLAAEWLRQNPDLRAELEAKKASDPGFAQDARGQLQWVYQRSPYYEPTHKRFPIYRVR
jgi:hypothetical protein